ncbi:hypothetical protein M514_10752, partial [Trichuris suis]
MADTASFRSASQSALTSYTTTAMDQLAVQKWKQQSRVSLRSFRAIAADVLLQSGLQPTVEDQKHCRPLNKRFPTHQIR